MAVVIVVVLKFATLAAAHDGENLWLTRVGKGGTLGGSQWGPAVDRDRLYVAISDVRFGRLLLEIHWRVVDCLALIWRAVKSR